MGQTSGETNNSVYFVTIFVRDIKVFEAMPLLVSLPKGKEYALVCMRNGSLTGRIELGSFCTCYVPGVVSHSIP